MLQFRMFKKLQDNWREIGLYTAITSARTSGEEYGVSTATANRYAQALDVERRWNVSADQYGPTALYDVAPLKTRSDVLKALAFGTRNERLEWIHRRLSETGRQVLDRKNNIRHHNSLKSDPVEQAKRWERKAKLFREKASELRASARRG